MTRFTIRSRDITTNERLMKSTIYKGLCNAKSPKGACDVKNS